MSFAARLDRWARPLTGGDGLLTEVPVVIASGDRFGEDGEAKWVKAVRPYTD